MLGHVIKDEDGVKRPVDVETERERRFGTRVAIRSLLDRARITELGLAGRVDGADAGGGSGSPATPSLTVGLHVPDAVPVA